LSWEPSPNKHILSSWKEIAAFFGKGVRTVQRWERELNLPVRRPNSDKQIVFAKAQELEGWLNRSPSRTDYSVKPNRRTINMQPQPIENAGRNSDLQRIRELAETIREVAERAVRTKRRGAYPSPRSSGHSRDIGAPKTARR
jgi:hypothetical protein